MTLTADMRRRANNVHNVFKEILSFYGWWESLVGGKHINGFRLCRYCGLPVENNWTACMECGA